MAISVNWGSKVIYIPKNDLVLIQASPEVRELDLDWLRLSLKDLEDDEEGMPFPDTHRHSTETTLGGLTYARVIEIINGYTVEFENGFYTVNCIGANHNLSDVKVINSVSLIVNNAAGLITNPAIEYASFNGGVTVDQTSSYSGTTYPVGTPRRPVNNLSDALDIANYRGFSTLYIIGDITINNALDFSGMNIIGESMTKSDITVSAGANVYKCEFYDCKLLGTLDGEAMAKNCRISDLVYINGVIEQCLLEPGVIELGGGATAFFLDCWCGGAVGALPTIDMGGSGQDLAMRNYSGAINIRNLSNPNAITITLVAGRVNLENTITNGIICIDGIGIVDDQSSGATTDFENLINPNIITEHINASQMAKRIKAIANEIL